MALKFKIGDMVRFTECTKFGASDLFGYIIDYYGKEIGLRHYAIRRYNEDTLDIYLRTTAQIKSMTNEEIFMVKLEN
jgi:hypothetical protein